MKLKKYSYLLVIILMLVVGISVVYAEEPSACGELFGKANDKGSLRYFVNDILKWIRYIVPVIIIVLGMIDFSKAVFADKEDVMRKAQSTFIKRILIGVAVFFVPTIVNVLMDFAEIILDASGMWDGYCGLE